MIVIEPYSVIKYIFLNSYLFVCVFVCFPVIDLQNVWPRLQNSHVYCE